MKLKTLYLILILIIGEVIIITGLNYFGKGLSDNILNSNIALVSLVFCLFSLELVNPILNIKDPAQSAVGGLGLRWFFSTIFIIGIIALVVYSFNKKELSITLYWMVAGVLALVFFLGLFFSKSASDKVAEIYEEEKTLRSGIKDIKAQLNELKFILDTNAVKSPELNELVNNMIENLRFLAPSNNSEATLLENQIIEVLTLVKSELKNDNSEPFMLIESLKKCELIFKQRKQLYSN